MDQPHSIAAERPALDWRTWLFIAVFATSMLPFSIDFQGSGVTANYFILVLFIVPLWGYQWSGAGLALAGTMVLSYLLALLRFSDFESRFLTRQLFSLIAGLVPVVLLFVRLRVRMRVVEQTILLVGLAYSLVTIGTLVGSGLSLTANVMLLKGTVGSQRFGFMLVLALACTLRPSAKYGRNILFALIVALGIVLQFSRAAYLSTAVAVAAFALAGGRAERKRARAEQAGGRPIPTIAFLLPLLAIVLAYIALPPLRTAVDMLFGRGLDAIDAYLHGDVSSSTISEQTRVMLWHDAMDFVLNKSTLFGSGMAGLYLVSPAYWAEGASAHSQYVDILLRTGLVGLVVYLFLWAWLLRATWSKSPALACGLLGMAVYGLFHETTKLSQGAVVFFILLNVVTSGEKESDVRKTAGEGNAAAAEAAGVRDPSAGGPDALGATT